ncbi:hypothetical protein POSPLADRAFT_1143790 [Postia placenta MAD-698-R-SB12]|uniref:Uncharacterized protein n=1 Tax=Postia placenta MAD-698-R-SB12 TaxID=670580 RepID=A0A1X6N1Z1_9APHY|nr:hypothetical protein POSPLADRAFT_1143790 [Postia placenta MAD-698-R-SB12]OSX62486.1 hypothetical protein POSPLADRAFT_1143790 [Postia placenta MAD-698-R-SB12]
MPEPTPGLSLLPIVIRPTLMHTLHEDQPRKFTYTRVLAPQRSRRAAGARLVSAGFLHAHPGSAAFISGATMGSIEAAPVWERLSKLQVAHQDSRASMCCAVADALYHDAIHEHFGPCILNLEGLLVLESLGTETGWWSADTKGLGTRQGFGIK